MAEFLELREIHLDSGLLGLTTPDSLTHGFGSISGFESAQQVLELAIDPCKLRPQSLDLARRLL